MEPLIAALSAADTFALASPQVAPAPGPGFDEHLDRAQRPSHTDRRTWGDAREPSTDSPPEGASAAQPASEKRDTAKRESPAEPADAKASTDAASPEEKDSNEHEASETAATPAAIVEQSALPATAVASVPTLQSTDALPDAAEASESVVAGADAPNVESNTGAANAPQPQPQSRSKRDHRAANLDAATLPPVGDVRAAHDADAPLENAAAVEPAKAERSSPARTASGPPAAPTVAVEVPKSASGPNARTAKRSAPDHAAQSAVTQVTASNKAAAKTGELASSQPPPSEANARSAESLAEGAQPAAHGDLAEPAPRNEPSPLGGQLAAEHNADATRTADTTSAATSDAHRSEPADFRREEASPLEAAGGRLDRDASAAAADRARFVERVARAFHAADQRGGPVRLRLSPPELGALRVEIEIRDGALSARLHAETTEARSLLLDGLPQLRERLASQDLRIERFEVELSSGSGHSSGERSRDGAQGDRAVFTPRHEAQRPAGASATAASTRVKSGEGRLDVVI